MKGWTPVTGTGRAATAVAVLWLAGGLVWTGWPVWDSVGAPDASQVRAEAPWVLGAQVAGLGLLASAMWRGAGRRPDALAAVTALVAGDCVLRTLFNPGTAGVEVVHALPLLAGAGLGLAGGVLTGASAALCSTMLASTPAETLPSQCVAWAAVGALGAVLRAVPTVTAWLLAVPLAVGAGVLSGVLLNLIGWAQMSGSTTEHYVPGLPAGEVLTRLWSYTVETSLALDTVRGLTTAFLVAVLGLPVLRALRGPTHRPTTYRPATDHALRAAVRRREDSSRIDALWAVTPTEQEKTCRS
ncbi:hypothetical protein JK386_17945 [Nocardioides sp. zg-536]|uniref:ECF transporter S component n=1 Tax=Nocardioides faecalis TaxID=2803858 RepID=A0A938Y7Z9_9ACTN|nr:hypothetical protein [Nocardioides faecalis]MBM9461778.1 hypothetical protein [Nocardioides faecalis]QVI57820.1 hypothetical protein KG111_12205 [Nocardioides faecalis]